MKTVIDADGCPVVNEASALCKRFNIGCIIVCDTAHRIEKEGTETLIVDKGVDSADFRIVNLLQKGDVVITQDYALAAMVLARGARAVNQNGMEYTNDNIDSLLAQRFVAKKVRDAGGRLKGPGKRTKEQNKAFTEAFKKILEESV